MENQQRHGRTRPARRRVRHYDNKSSICQCHRLFHNADIKSFMISPSSSSLPSVHPLLPLQRIATFAIVAASLFSSAHSFSHHGTSSVCLHDVFASGYHHGRKITLRRRAAMKPRPERSSSGSLLLLLSSSSQSSMSDNQRQIDGYGADGISSSSTALSSLLNEVRTSTTTAKQSTVQSFRQIRQHVVEELRTSKDFEPSSALIVGMIDYLRDVVVNARDEKRPGAKSVVSNDADDGGTDASVDRGRKSAKSTQQPGSTMLSLEEEDRRIVSEIIDETLQAFFARAFATPYRGIDAWERINLALELLQLQLSSSAVLVTPYDTVPKGVLVRALQAVTGLLEGPPPQYYHHQQRKRQREGKKNRPVPQQQTDRRSQKTELNPDVAFRLLQRLVTGVGMRNYPKTMLKLDDISGEGQQGPQKVPMVAQLYEVDFNRVLNVYSNLGKMEMAHRVIALQERTPHAPSLSPVTYSILLKGYGKLGEWNNIDMLIRHGAASGVKPDTIMFNSLMDAYINCDQIDKAWAVFNAMKKHHRCQNVDGDEKGISDIISDFPFRPEDCPTTNIQSYNTLLKGLARRGSWNEAKSIASEMEQNKTWNHITTNTLVNAACKAKEYEEAERLLADKTVDLTTEGIVDTSNIGKRRPKSRQQKQQQQQQQQQSSHPNADAYTSLMNSYGTEGRVDKALALLRTMRQRGVTANEFHFSCLVGALARKRQVDKAHRMIAHVRTIPAIGDHPVLYNSFISGLVHHSSVTDEEIVAIVGDEDYDKYVDDAVGVLRTMIERQIYLDVSTVAVILDGFGRCLHPRVVEAVTLVEKLEKERLIPQSHIKVSTALIRVFAAANDLRGAIRTFRKISRPDVPAVNALLDAAVRCGNSEVATETFRFYFDPREKNVGSTSTSTSSSNPSSPRLQPDVISYTCLIRSELTKGTNEGSREARKLYEEMKFQRRIFPDKVLVNVIIRELVEKSRSGRIGGAVIQASDARFAAGVLRDAEQLKWDDGQLERRKHVTELAMRKCVGSVWDEEAGLYGLWKSSSSKSEEDEQQNTMFERHGWNQVDSGFQLWGAGKRNVDLHNVSSSRRTSSKTSVADNGIGRDKFLQSKGWNDMESGFRIF